MTWTTSSVNLSLWTEVAISHQSLCVLFVSLCLTTMNLLTIWVAGTSTAVHLLKNREVKLAVKSLETKKISLPIVSSVSVLMIPFTCQLSSSFFEMLQVQIVVRVEERESRSKPEDCLLSSSLPTQRPVVYSNWEKKVWVSIWNQCIVMSMSSQSFTIITVFLYSCPQSFFPFSSLNSH